LEQNVNLEELNLEQNHIIRIEGLLTLSKLKRLELGGNKINKIGNISSLKTLMQLSLEDN